MSSISQYSLGADGSTYDSAMQQERDTKAEPNYTKHLHFNVYAQQNITNEEQEASQNPSSCADNIETATTNVDTDYSKMPPLKMPGLSKPTHLPWSTSSDIFVEEPPLVKNPQQDLPEENLQGNSSMGVLNFTIPNELQVPLVLNQDRKQTLRNLLVFSSTHFRIEFRGYLSNHLVHALIALYHLGATSARMGEFTEYYIQRLSPYNERATKLIKKWIGIERTLEEKERWKKCEFEIAGLSASDQERIQAKESEMDRIALDKEEEKNLNSLPMIGPSKLSPQYDKPADVVITMENWRAYLGRRKYFLSYFRFFLSNLHAYKDRGHTIYDMVAGFLPQLVRGVGHSALHPLLHAGWSASVAPLAEECVCEGLAYMCFSYFPLDRTTSGYSAENFLHIPESNSISMLKVLNRCALVFYPMLESMKEAIGKIPYAEMPIGCFQKSVIWVAMEHPQTLLNIDIQLKVEEKSFRNLASFKSFTADVYNHLFFLYCLSDNDFFVLHAITYFYGLAQFLPALHIKDARLAFRYSVKAILATWVAQGLTGWGSHHWRVALETSRLDIGISSLLADGTFQKAKNVTWDVMIAASIKSNDVHTQKFVWVAWNQAKEGTADADLCHLAAYQRLIAEDADLTSSITSSERDIQPQLINRVQKDAEDIAKKEAQASESRHHYLEASEKNASAEEKADTINDALIDEENRRVASDSMKPIMAAGSTKTTDSNDVTKKPTANGDSSLSSSFTDQQ